jgi:hypothetical protein
MPRSKKSKKKARKSARRSHRRGSVCNREHWNGPCRNRAGEFKRC